MTLSKYENQRPKVSPPWLELSDLRGALGLTQEDVCQRIEAITDQRVTKGWLSGVEKGHRGVSPEKLAALEVVLKLKPGRLRTAYEPSHSRQKAERAS